MQPAEAFPPRRRVFLMRHGEVNYFENGRPVPPPEARLNEEGRQQAAAVARVLAQVPIDRAVASGLSRTVETARIVLGERAVELEIVAELQEIRGGRVADLPRDELRRVFVHSLTHGLTADGHFLAGEHFGEFRDRVVPAFRALLDAPGWRSMLVVAHGAVNRALLADIFCAPIESMGHMEQDAGCINLIEIDDRGYGIVRLLNFTPYNQVKQGLELTTMERYFLEFPEHEG
jgi:probable phosphoglycerate mutase